VRGVRQSRILSSHPSFSAPASSTDEIPHGHTFHPPSPHGDPPSHGLSVAATLARRRLRSSLARPLGGSGPSLAWHAGSAGSGPSALPPVARRKRRRRDVRPSLACRELRLLLLRMAAARCPCLPSHRPHTGPRASNHCSAGARSLAPVSSITRHTISSPFALF